MGTIPFQLRPDFSPGPPTGRDPPGMLGGQDNMPYAAQIVVEPDRLLVVRHTDESGYVMAPWEVEGAGRLMTSTPTVIERDQPYQLQVELARGKVNQVRSQAADWLMGG